MITTLAQSNLARQLQFDIVVNFGLEARTVYLTDADKTAMYDLEEHDVKALKERKFMMALLILEAEGC